MHCLTKSAIISFSFLAQVIVCQYVAAYETESKSTTGQGEKCVPKQDILFFRTYKTASSTLQNILLRNADSRNLLIAFEKDELDPSYTIIDPQVLTRKFNRSYSMFMTTARQHNFSDNTIRTILPPDALRITILRDSVAEFSSLYRYFQLDKDVCWHSLSLSEFADSAERWLVNRSTDDMHHLNCRSQLGGRNQMSYDLGLKIEDFDDEDRVRQFIGLIDDQTDLVLITEKMDESLILMKDLLCWETRDIVAFHQNAASSYDKGFIPNIHEKEVLREINHADEMLYRHFLKKHEKQVQHFGQEKMATELNLLAEMRDQKYKECIDHEEPRVIQHQMSQYILRLKTMNFVAKKNASKECQDLASDFTDFEHRIKRKQFDLLLL